MFLIRDFMSNFFEMTPQWLQKKFKLLKYEHIIYSLKILGGRLIIWGLSNTLV